jgi:hypothetical protein
MPTLSLTFTGLTGRGPFSLAAITFSQAVPVADQIEVVKNGTALGAVAYTTVPGTTSLVLAAGYDLVPSDTLVVTRVTDQVSLYSQYSAYGLAPAEGTILNSQQSLFLLQELQSQIDGLSSGGSTLDSLTDTDVDGATNGQVLTYDYATSKWIPATIAGAGSIDGNSTTIQVRRNLAAAWASVNPVLASGEIGYETDTNKFKFGDGSTDWNTLTYFSPGGGGGGGGSDVTIVETFPADPEQGDLIFHALRGRGYIYLGTTWIEWTGGSQQTGLEPAQDSYAVPFVLGDLGSAILDSATDGGSNEVYLNESTTTSSTVAYFPCLGYLHNYNGRSSVGAQYSQGDGVSSTSLVNGLVVHDIGVEPTTGLTTCSDTVNCELDNATSYFSQDLVWMNRDSSPAGDYPSLLTEPWLSFGFRNRSAINTVCNRTLSSTAFQNNPAIFIRNGTRPITDWANQNWRITLDMCGMGGFTNNVSRGPFKYGIYFFPGIGDVLINELNVQGGRYRNYTNPRSGLFFGYTTQGGGNYLSTSTDNPYRLNIIQGRPSELDYISIYGDGGDATGGWQAVVGATPDSIELFGQSVDTNGHSLTDYKTNWPNLDTTYQSGYYNFWRIKCTISWDAATEQLVIREYLLPGYYFSGAAGTSQPAVLTLSSPNLTNAIRQFQEPLQMYQMYFFNTTNSTISSASSVALAPILFERL